MATPTQAATPAAPAASTKPKIYVPARCTDKVALAEISDSLPVQAIGLQRTLRLGSQGVEALYLHPQGLYVQRTHARADQKPVTRWMLIPFSRISFMEIEPEVK